MGETSPSGCMVAKPERWVTLTVPEPARRMRFMGEEERDGRVWRRYEFFPVYRVPAPSRRI